jgi:T6SS immunity protein Tdi1, C-terminal
VRFFSKKAPEPAVPTAVDAAAAMSAFGQVFTHDPVGSGPPNDWTNELTEAIVGRASPLITTFMHDAAWTSYNRGIWRFFLPDRADFAYWTTAAGWAEDWPKYRGIRLFGYDWLGRLVGVDGRKGRPSGSEVVRLEPGFGELVMTDGTVEDFLTRDLVEGYDDTLSTDLFDEWIAGPGRPLQPEECVGFKKPPLIGGTDEVDNLEITSLKVFVSISGQIATQVAKMPPGAKITGVKFG